MKQCGVALAVFAYNRANHLRDCLASIEGNEEVKHLDVHIFIDGSLNEISKTTNEAVLGVAIEFAQRHPNCVISHSDINLGLRRSVVSGLTALFSKYEAVIVVEDDLVVSRDFVQFMLRTLDCFANDKTVGSISGFAEARFPFFVPSDLIATRRQSCWGWATWNDRWDSISWEDSKQGTKEYLENIALLSPIGWDLQQIYKAQIAGRISSWAINFDLHAARHRWRSLQPRHTLVQNNGMDGSGTHLMLKTKGVQPSIAGKTSGNVRIDSYSSSWIYDYSLRIRHSRFYNIIDRVTSYIKLRIDS